MMDIFRACFLCASLLKNRHDFFNVDSKKYFAIGMKKIIIKEEDNLQQS